MTIKEQVTEIWNSYKDNKKPTAAEIHKILCEKLQKNISSSNIRDIVRQLKKSQDEYLQNFCEAEGIPQETIDRYWLKDKSKSVLVVPGREEVTIEQLSDMFLTTLENIKPITPNIPSIIPGNNLLIIDPADVHFGKLASEYQTGESYDCQTAYQRLVDGVNGILEKSKGFDIGRVLLVIGNDILHYDTRFRTTTSGTPQDSDVMFFDMYNIAFEGMIHCIDTIYTMYPYIDIVFNPSNHDFMSGFMLARGLEAWYRNYETITFDTSMKHRKYYKFGNSMIATSHGDGAKMNDLPLLMAHESPVLWGECKYRYCYLHHIHHKKQFEYVAKGQDFIGVTIEFLRSPSNADSWHTINGYTGVKKAIEGFIHSNQDGQIARLTHLF